MFVKTDTQYIAAGTIVRIDGFTGTITSSSVSLDHNGVASFPTYTITAPATGETRVIVVDSTTHIEIPA